MFTNTYIIHEKIGFGIKQPTMFYMPEKYTKPNNRGCPRGVMVKAMDCGIVVREFVLQSRYYVHFQANTLGKGLNHQFSVALLFF